MRTLWAAAAALWLAACAGPAPEALYERAEKLERSGELREALEVARRGLRRHGEPAGGWHWRFRLLTAEVLLDLGESREALEMLEAGPAPSAELEARRQMNLGDARYWLADRAGAQRALEQARRLAEGAGAALRARIELRDAAVQSGFAEMEARYRRALELAGADPFLAATARAGLGYNRLKHSRYDEAIPWYEQAQKDAAAAGAARLSANVLGNLGTCYAGLGDYERALELLKQAEAAAARIGDKRNQEFWLGNIGNLLQQRGDLGGAADYFARARALAEQRGNREWLSTVLNREAEASIRAGDLETARRLNRRSSAIRRELKNPALELFSDLTSARLARLEALESAGPLLRKVTAAAEELREPRVLWEAHAEMAALERARGSRGSAARHYRAAIATIDKQWARLSRDQFKITFLANLIRFYREYVDFLAEGGEDAAALEAAESVRSRVLAEKLGVAPAAGGLDVSELSARLRRRRAAALVYWLAPRRSFAWLITGAGLTRFDLPGEAEIARLVQDYQRLLLARRDPLERPYAARTALYDAVLRPARARIAAGAQVILVPDGALHGLNFETLVVEEGRPRYWVEDVIVSVAPSLRVLRWERREPRRPNLLFIGDPEPPAGEFPPLPHLKEELAIIRDAFPAPARRIYSRAEATPAAYREAGGGKFSAIHLAAHAVANPASPLNSAVVLSRRGESYKLYAQDVLEVPLEAELVTLSACRGAGARSYSGEGLMGFTWAFLQAGARHVVAGLWDVDDAATARLMGELYGGLAAGRHPDDALRAAKLALLRAGGPHRRPFFWGPFQLFTRVVD